VILVKNLFRNYFTFLGFLCFIAGIPLLFSSALTTVGIVIAVAPAAIGALKITAEAMRNYESFGGFLSIGFGGSLLASNQPTVVVVAIVIIALPAIFSVFEQLTTE
jgi:hypothetical protein